MTTIAWKVLKIIIMGPISSNGLAYKHGGTKPLIDHIYIYIYI